MPPLRFDRLRTVDDVSRAWGVSVADLETIATADLSVYYRPLQIPKKGRRRGDTRTVHKVEWGVLAQLQKNIARDITQAVTFPACVHGFVPGRSAVSNAAAHLGQRVLLHADIQHFFDAIDAQRVTQAFTTLGCPADTSTLLAKACTLHERLPQGASTSPVLANLVCLPLDAELTALSTARSVRYTRYADDLTFSGDLPLPIETVTQVLARHGFAVHPDKVRTQWKGSAQYVTGLSTTDTVSPRVPRRVKRRLRLELHYARRFGLAAHQEYVDSEMPPSVAVRRWKGWLDYLYSVPAERPLAQRWFKVLETIVKDEPGQA